MPKMNPVLSAFQCNAVQPHNWNCALFICAWYLLFKGILPLNMEVLFLAITAITAKLVPAFLIYSCRQRQNWTCRITSILFQLWPGQRLLGNSHTKTWRQQAFFALPGFQQLIFRCVLLLNMEAQRVHVGLRPACPLDTRESSLKATIKTDFHKLILPCVKFSFLSVLNPLPNDLEHAEL